MRVLVAAGLDPSGGAGLSADVEALLAVGARPLPVATALTVQGADGALGFETVSPRLLLAQILGLFPRSRGESPGRSAFPVSLPAAAPGGEPARGAGPRAASRLGLRAVKTGMLGSGANALALARLFADGGALRGLPLVVDPVLAASSGLPLLRTGRGRSPFSALAPLLAEAALVTPNLSELEVLAGLPAGALRSDDDAVAAARALPCEAVLVKGGHRRGAPVDLLVARGAVRRFEGRRRRGEARGTGCRLASAIAGLLARGSPLAEAILGGKQVVERYLDEPPR